MTKKIEIHGQRVRLYSLDEGRTWASSQQSIIAYGQRQTTYAWNYKRDLNA